jgi:hypothetical protein
VVSSLIVAVSSRVVVRALKIGSGYKEIELFGFKQARLAEHNKEALKEADKCNSE